MTNDNDRVPRGARPPRAVTGKGIAVLSFRPLKYVASVAIVSLLFAVANVAYIGPTIGQAPTAAAGGAGLNVDVDQCGNLATPCTWQNGNLNSSNSAYAEGDVVPFRLAIENLPAGSHTIHLNYELISGGHVAYDFLARYDTTETVNICATGGGARSSLCDAAMPVAIPAARTRRATSAVISVVPRPRVRISTVC